jgi:hypothetical protein
MTDVNMEFPSASDSDAQDVATAVMTANALWRQGESAEAIRWLRRAAETAEALGDDMRALSLARVAAELQDNVEADQPPPPPAAGAEASSEPAPSPSDGPPPPETPPPVEPARSRSSRPPPTAPSVIPSARMVSISKDGMSSPTVRAVPVRVATAYATRTSEHPPPVRRSEPPPPARRSDPPPARAPSDPPPADARRSEPPAARAHGSDAPPPLTRAEIPRIDIHTTVRVSVEPSPDDHLLLVVRILREGEQPPIGAREALLVPLQSGVDLRYL